MGKSLSIIAIAISTYDIKGYPSHTDDTMDFELPWTLEHLRPYFRKREHPLLSPSDIAKINAEIFASKAAVRDLLAAEQIDISDTQKSTAASDDSSVLGDTFVIEFGEMIETLKTGTSELFASDSETLTKFGSFLDLFQQQYHLYPNRNETVISDLMKTYKELKFHPAMFELILRIIEPYDQFKQVSKYQDLLVFLTSMAFPGQYLQLSVQELASSSPSEKLIFTLRQVERDMFVLSLSDEKRRWLYVKLMEDARTMNLLPTAHEIITKSYQFLNKNYSAPEIDKFGVIMLDTSTNSDFFEVAIDGEKPQEFAIHAQHIMDLCDIKQEYRYPYLTNNYMLKFKYLFRVLRDGSYNLAAFGLRQADKSNGTINHNLKIIKFFQDTLIEFYNHKHNITDAKDQAKQMGQKLIRNGAIHSFLNVDDESMITTDIHQFYVGNT